MKIPEKSASAETVLSLNKAFDVCNTVSFCVYEYFETKTLTIFHQHYVTYNNKTCWREIVEENDTWTCNFAFW